MTDKPMIPLRLIPPARRRSGVISVTMPSRERTAKLEASIGSLREQANRPELLEILVAHDPDDAETPFTANRLKADVVWEAPERYGYAGSARYWAELLTWATGEWVLPTWSDDAIMKTAGWDELLRTQPPGSVAYLDGNYPGLTCFPAVHADALGAVGRLAPLPALDTWWEYAGRDAGVLVTPGIYVHQNRPDLTGCPPDKTHAEGGGAWRAGAGGTPHQAFYAEPYVTWRAQDTAALARHRKLEDDYQARMADWSDIGDQMPLLRAAARGYHRPVIAELGTRTGQSTAALLAGASASGGHVWSVDSGPVAAPDWWREDDGGGLWSFLPADDMSADAARWVPPELDVLFIDTSHEYQHTLDELHEYAPRVRPGGTVLCHDVELRHDAVHAMGRAWVDQAVHGPEYPVAAALDKFCADTGLTWVRQEYAEPPEGRTFYGLGTIIVP